MAKSKPVVVTTEHKGVFFGYQSRPLSGGVVTLTQARNCLYWSADVKGFMGLAATGPSKSCRVGPEVPAIELTAVTSVIDATPEAAQRWSAAPWA